MSVTNCFLCLCLFFVVICLRAISHSKQLFKCRFQMQARRACTITNLEPIGFFIFAMLCLLIVCGMNT